MTMKCAPVAWLGVLIAFACCGLPAMTGAAQSLAPARESAVEIRFSDSATGYAIQPETIAARTHRAGAAERKFGAAHVGKSGRGNLTLERGRHTISASSPAHHPMSGEVEVREGNPYRIHFLLDPLEQPRELQPDYIATQHRDDATLIQGFMVDDDSGEPLRGVRVRSLPTGVETASDARGFFRLYVPVQSEEEQADSPANLIFDKPGYRAEERLHLELWPRGDWSYTIRLERGAGRRTVDERTLRRRAPATRDESPASAAMRSEDSPIQPFPAPGEPAEFFFDDIEPASTASSNATVRVPRNVRVLKNGVVEYVSMNFYARRVLPAEWIASWGNIAGGSNSLNAGAVSVRSYAINRLNGVGPNSDYDICATSSCQVYGDSTSGNTTTAVNFTEDHVMINASGNIASTEYSAENNSLGFSCGDGFTQPSGGCLYDPVCRGESRFGHGRGLCQWGSARWATGRRMAGRSTGDSTPNGFPRRSWTWMLAHYYPNLRLVKGAPLMVGDDIKARTASNCQVRACPGGGIENGVSCALITTKAAGQTGVIIGGPLVITNDGKGFTWYQVQWNDAGPTVGWSAENYLERVFPTPAAPTSLVATAVATNQINLSWTDTGDIESHFEIERAAGAAGPWLPIGTVPANVAAYADNPLPTGSTWFYRVRAYNAGGASGYTGVASATTPDVVAPTLPPIPDQTVTAGSLLTFTNAAVAPERVHLITDFEPFLSETANGVVLFRTPNFSPTTSGFLDGAPATDIAAVADNYPTTGHGAGMTLHVRCTFTNASDPWLRLTTAGAATLPNPVINLTGKLRFNLYTDKSVRVAVGCRETTAAAGATIGSDGGTSGAIEWAGVTNVAGGAPMPNRVVAASNWTALTFDFPNEPIRSFSGGNGVLATASGMGVLEHLAIVPAAGIGLYNFYLDNFAVLASRSFTYSLGAGAPTNASIHPTTGVFAWTPDQSQSPATNSISVIVTDDSVPPLSATNTFTVVVKESVPNQAPMLSPIANYTINAGATLTFANSAFDPNPGDTLTFSLDPGAPPAAAIHPVTGVFNWTPADADTNSVHPITVRVTDDGAPPMSGSASFSVTVLPRNYPPVLGPVSNHTLHAGGTAAFTASAYDPNPGDTLTFSLDPGAPAAASIHPSTGDFSWTTGEADAGAVKQITLRVSDDGSPPLSGTATFSVTVVSRPGIQSVASGEQGLTLTWSAIPGATYRVQYKNSLTDPEWETLGNDITATNSTASAMDASIESITQRFYRILVMD